MRIVSMSLNQIICQCGIIVPGGTTDTRYTDIHNPLNIQQNKAICNCLDKKK